MKPGKFRVALAGLLALAASAAATAKPLPRAPKPALWKLSDADTTIYLFGTIHALPANFAWENERLTAAFATADRLVIEALVDPDPAKNAALLMRLADSPGLPRLAERVPANQRARLAELIAESRMPPAMLDRMETWAAALVLGTGAMAKLEVTREEGVEERLKTIFAVAHKPIEAFETPEIQLGFFDTLPEADQRAFLAGVIEEPKDTRDEFGKMLSAWSRGDDKAIARSFDDEMKATPGLFTALIARRNAAWADALVHRLDRPGTTLVAVGAGHLAGRDSVQAMLAKRGYKVVRVQ